MLNLDEALYPISAAARASLLEHGTARSWVQKGYLLLGAGTAKDWRTSIRGKATLLSARTVLQMAIGAELAALGFHPQRACRIAIAFTAISTDDRAPGELYGGKAFTALLAYRDLDVGNVLPADQRTLLRSVFFSESGRRNSAVVVFLDFIVDRVITRLQQESE